MHSKIENKLEYVPEAGVIEDRITAVDLIIHIERPSNSRSRSSSDFVSQYYQVDPQCSSFTRLCIILCEICSDMRIMETN
ncbi:hypothetical protein LWI28_021392 [Acer negundo]|uniref:Uncharacterized protein n=1 Tax=Acer negundo TaxID=4023 RepID=A0AAD5I735_ACENE|nr:hypothetical protein LWI28_021392 [Acer negundo]KAK4851813.1 hypothetical protein QYF36_018625 [Acer negundo]